MFFCALNLPMNLPCERKIYFWNCKNRVLCGTKDTAMNYITRVIRGHLNFIKNKAVLK